VETHVTSTIEEEQIDERGNGDSIVAKYVQVVSIGQGKPTLGNRDFGGTRGKRVWMRVLAHLIFQNALPKTRCQKCCYTFCVTINSI
jgi:hypothetical protein